MADCLGPCAFSFVIFGICQYLSLSTVAFSFLPLPNVAPLQLLSKEKILASQPKGPRRSTSNVPITTQQMIHQVLSQHVHPSSELKE